MKHTPGPWRVEVVTEKDEFRAVTAGEFAIVSKDNLCPATVWEAALGEGGIANANLIAAAPEMLEQLEYCVGMLEVHFPPGGKTLHGIEVEPNYLDAPKAAIAKAKGEVD
jgi:hypothetical protein